MSELERIVEVSPSFDKRSDDPSKNYGIGGCRITFVLKGERGAVQFVIGTEWFVPSAREHLLQFPPRDISDLRKPKGWDVGYHAKVAQYEGQETMGGDCEYTGGPCYYDGSGCRADEWVEDFIAGGTAWLWPKLEQEYKERFNPSPPEAMKV